MAPPDGASAPGPAPAAAATVAATAAAPAAAAAAASVGAPPAALARPGRGRARRPPRPPAAAGGSSTIPRFLIRISLLTAFFFYVNRTPPAARDRDGNPRPERPRDPAWASPAEFGLRPITGDNFTDLVISSRDVWFLEFHSPRCETCRQLQPVWEAAMDRFGPRAMFGTVNIDTKRGKDLATDLGVLTSGVPAIVAFLRHGAETGGPIPPMVDVLKAADPVPTVAALTQALATAVARCDSREVRGPPAPPAPLPAALGTFLTAMHTLGLKRTGLEPIVRLLWEGAVRTAAAAVARLRAAPGRGAAGGGAGGGGPPRVFLKLAAEEEAARDADTKGAAESKGASGGKAAAGDKAGKAAPKAATGADAKGQRRPAAAAAGKPAAAPARARAGQDGAL